VAALSDRLRRNSGTPTGFSVVPTGKTVTPGGLSPCADRGAQRPVFAAGNGVVRGGRGGDGAHRRDILTPPQWKTFSFVWRY